MNLIAVLAVFWYSNIKVDEYDYLWIKDNKTLSCHGLL